MQQHEALHKYNQHIILKAAERNLPAARLRLDRLPPLLPHTPFRSTAVAAPVPQEPDASAKPNVPVTSSAAAARGRKAIRAATSLGGAPRKYSAERHCSHRTVLKSRSRSRYLQLVACADRIEPSRVAICSARDEGQARMRKSPCEGCFVVHPSSHSICDGRRSTLSDPTRPIQCSASARSKILCER